MSAANAVSDQDAFEYWLTDMADALERLRQSAPSELAPRLDLSPESLPLLEHWVLQTYADTADMQPAAEAQRLDAMARYVGEVLRKRLGGRWAVELKDKRNAFHGLPLLRGMAGQRSDICPLTLVTASADRRTGRYLSTILDNLVANSRAAA